MIYDGPSPASSVLLRFSGVYTGSQLVISSQNHLYIYFYSNYAVSGRGFTINYKQGVSLDLCWYYCDSGCDNVIRQSHGTLLSAGHTQVPYPNSRQCSYTIEVPDNTNQQPIALAVNMFDVQDDDYLQIYDGGDKSGKPFHAGRGFSGSSRPPANIVSRHGKLHMIFRTNPVGNALGWNITFSTSESTFSYMDTSRIF